jgi:hypothetical protein
MTFRDRNLWPLWQRVSPSIDFDKVEDATETPHRLVHGLSALSATLTSLSFEIQQWDTAAQLPSSAFFLALQMWFPKSTLSE